MLKKIVLELRALLSAFFSSGLKKPPSEGPRTCEVRLLCAFGGMWWGGIGGATLLEGTDIVLICRKEMDPETHRQGLLRRGDGLEQILKRGCVSPAQSSLNNLDLASCAFWVFKQRTSSHSQDPGKAVEMADPDFIWQLTASHNVQSRIKILLGRFIII